MSHLRIGIDIGGAFTDLCVLHEEEGRFFNLKVPTTPGDLTQGVTEALDGFDGYVTLHGARDDYGVVIDPQTMSIDYKATESLRKERRAQFI